MNISVIFCTLLLCFSYYNILAQDFYYSYQSGSWNDPNTWSLIGHGDEDTDLTTVPGNATTDVVIIAAGHVIDYNADDGTNTATISTLSIGASGTAGYLRFPFTNYNPAGTVDDLNANHDLIVTGNVTIGTDGHLVTTRGGDEYPAGVINTMNGTPADRDGHDIFIGGNLINDGILDLQNDNDAAYEVELHFNGTDNQTISGGINWDTYNITYNNSGAFPDNQIINQSEEFTLSVEAGRSTFTQGTYVHNNDGIYNNQGSNNDGTDYTDVSFTINRGIFNLVTNHDGNRTVSLTNGNIIVDGVNGGQFNAGSNGALGTTLELANNSSLGIENGGIVTIGSSTGNTGDLNLLGDGVSGATVTIDGATSSLTVYNNVNQYQNSSFTQNDGTLIISPNITTNTEGIYLRESGASFTMNAGTLNILNSVEVDANAIRLLGENCSVNLLGGTATLGNDAGHNEGRIRFDNATNAGTLTISGASTVVNLYDGFTRSNSAAANVTVSNGAQLVVAPDNDNIGDIPIQSIIEGTLTISENSTATFGRGINVGNVNISGSASLEANIKFASTSNILGAFTQDDATSQSTFNDRIDIEAGASLTLNNGTIDIIPDITTADNTELQIRGTLTMNGGTINMGANVTNITNGNLLQVYDGGALTINTGSFNILTSPSLTSIANRNPFNITNEDAGEDATRGDGVVTIGNGTGGTQTAQLIIAPNLAAELPSPSTRNILDMDGANSVLTINSDGYLEVGGGNIGNLRLNTAGAQFIMNGGTCHVTASLTLDNGTTAEVNGGTLNVGTTASNGTNRVIYSQSNPTAITSLTLNGGTINVGDGNSRFNIGNDDENPAFGTTTAFGRLQIADGTFNLNGSFNLDDANARFIMSSGAFNLNPQGSQSLDSDISIFDLEQGIVDITGGTITIVNPHATSGSGSAIRINGVGAAGNGDNQISGVTNLPSADSPVIFGGTLRLGDGSANLAGSVDGFDLNLSDDHTYGTIEINNPTGSNRHVEIVSTNNNYLLSGDLDLTAGTLNINNNTIDRTAVGGTFDVGANSLLIIGNTNAANHFPGSNTAFATYGVDITSTVEYDGVGNALVVLPLSTQFGNLIISGSSTKTLNKPETVRRTLTLEGGTFATGANLIMDAASTVLRTDGVMTGSIQGGNAYTIAYEGTTKATQDPEWSGTGEKSLIVYLDVSETLNLHTDLTAQGSLTITEGILNDNSYTLTVGGNVDNSSFHTGTGKIYLTGSLAERTIGGDGSGEFENLELDDTNGASLSVAQTINGTLTLTDGVLDIDSYLLSLPTTASVSVASPSATTMIEVNGGVGAAGVRKTYVGSGGELFTWPIGSNGKYTPTTVEVVNATSGGTITLNPVDAENPFTTDAADIALDYYWIVSKSGFGSEIANLSFTYDQTDATGRGNESGYVPARYAPTTWSNINDVALVDEVANTISFNNVTYIEGQFTAAEPSEFGTVLTYYSRADGDWNTASSWSTIGLGGAAASTIPGSSTPVIIGNNNTITIASDNTIAPSVELQSTGTLTIADATTGHNLGTLSGEGTLSIVTDDTDATEFPGGSYTDLLGATGGTIEYTGTGNYTALATPTTFRNLAISGSGTVTLPDADLSILEDLIISATAPTSTTLLSSATSGDISIGNNLTIDNSDASLQFQSGTDRTVILAGDVTNSGTLQVIDVGFATHSLFIGGSLTNNGTINLVSTDALHHANVTFSGATSTSISGTGGTTDLYRLIVNKGTDASSELEVTSANFTLSAPTNTGEKALEIQNGTLKLSAPHPLTLSTGGGNFSIPTSGGLWLNDAGAVAEITSASANLSLGGLLRLTDGTINIGDDLTGVDQNAILYAPGNAAITVEGGTLTVGGAIRPNPDAATLSYEQSGGTVVVANNLSSSENIGNNSEADLAIATGSGSSFTMSGGLLEIVRRNSGADGKAIYIRPSTSHNVSGGTVRVLNSNTATNFDVGINSAVPFWDLEIGDGNSFTERIGTSGGAQDLTVLNDLTVNVVDGTFQLYQANTNSRTNNDIDLSVGGNFTLTNGTFIAGTPSVVTFNGSGLGGQSSPQIVSGSPTFYSVNVNNTSGGIRLDDDIAVEGDWTYTTGTFNQNTHLVTFSGTNAQTIGGNPLSFDDLTIDKASNNVSLDASQMTVTSSLTLINGILALGNNRLSFTAAATIPAPTLPDEFDNTRMITTTGQDAAQG
ncbi:MAG: hypothetical protein WBA23_07155, partial [Tunicatimonas sp.]|uniref:hypothetical protein n=1 Tax=Tunicatimonas sp. TaxID=1940096 RepID=UPI003C70DAA6